MMRSDVQPGAVDPRARDQGRPDRRRREGDETDYAQRAFINLIATIFLLVIATGMVWTVQALDAQERLRRCIDTGQRECVQIVPPQPGIRLVPNH